jgi:hypothetical protein
MLKFNLCITYVCGPLLIKQTQCKQPEYQVQGRTVGQTRIPLTVCPFPQADQDLACDVIHIPIKRTNATNDIKQLPTVGLHSAVINNLL